MASARALRHAANSAAHHSQRCETPEVWERRGGRICAGKVRTSRVLGDTEGHGFYRWTAAAITRSEVAGERCSRLVQDVPGNRNATKDGAAGRGSRDGAASVSHAAERRASTGSWGASHAAAAVAAALWAARVTPRRSDVLPRAAPAGFSAPSAPAPGAAWVQGRREPRRIPRIGPCAPAPTARGPWPSG